METPASSPNSTPKLRQRRLAAAATLLLLTAVAGAVTRSAAPAAKPAPGTAGTQFTAPAGGPVSFTGHLDRSAVQVGGDGVVRMELVLGAERRPETAMHRVPTDLVVILDRSGSMDGDKITNARAAVRDLVARLDAQDRFALVTYSDAAQVTIPLESTSDEARRRWLATVEQVGPGGGTNMSAGLDLTLDDVLRGHDAGRVPRVILISDGLANQGDATPEGLVSRARRAARNEWSLTTVGVGADFNEYLMTALADAGTGNYYFVSNATDLGDVFAREFGAARATVASALAVEIEPAAGVRVVDAAGYPLEQSGSHVVFRPGTLFAGQERRVWVTLAVPQDAAAERDLGRFALAYKAGGVEQRLAFAETPHVSCVASEEAFVASVDVPLWEQSVVVEEWNRMQNEVARQVKDGERAGALATVERFRDDTNKLNQRLKSEVVQKKLDELRAVEGQVADAFTGADQKEKQNTLSKARSAAAYDARRAGSKY